MSTCPDFIASVRAAQCFHLFSFLTSKSIFLLKVNSFTTPQIIFRIPEPNPAPDFGVVIQFYFSASTYIEESYTIMTIITRPEKLDVLEETLLTLGINGMTATPVKGCGRQNAHPPPSQLPLHNRLKNQYHSFPIVPLHR